MRAAAAKAADGTRAKPSRRRPKDFDKERNESNRETADAGDQAGKEHACEDKASSIESEREGRSAPMEFRENRG